VSTRITALLLVAGLVFAQTVGPRVLPAGVGDLLGFLLLAALSLLVVWTLHRSDRRRTASPIGRVWAHLGWRIPAAVMVLASAAAVVTLVRWPWQPRADFDVLGVLWVLQNGPGVALVAMFGVIAVVNFGGIRQARAASLLEQKRVHPG
jgi:hypothetical protein